MSIAEDDVIFCSTVDDVIALPALQVVDTRPAEKLIIAPVAADNVRAILAVDSVIAPLTVGSIVLCAEKDGVARSSIIRRQKIAIIAIDNITPRARINTVAPAASMDQIIAVATTQRIITATRGRNRHDHNVVDHQVAVGGPGRGRV